MDRAEFLTLIDVARQRGLEIGALNRPIITRDMGPVEYIDRASRADLAAWYAEPGIPAAFHTGGTLPDFARRDQQRADARRDAVRTDELGPPGRISYSS